MCLYERIGVQNLTGNCYTNLAIEFKQAWRAFVACYSFTLAHLAISPFFFFRFFVCPSHAHRKKRPRKIHSELSIQFRLGRFYSAHCCALRTMTERVSHEFTFCNGRPLSPPNQYNAAADDGLGQRSTKNPIKKRTKEKIESSCRF